MGVEGRWLVWRSRLVFGGSIRLVSTMEGRRSGVGGGDVAARRTSVLARQLAQELSPVSFLQPAPCLAYQPPEFHSGAFV